MTPPASGGIPHGYYVDHHAPSHFVVRCTHCGRIALTDDRARAHNRADNHAFTCRPTGVTPVSKREDTAESEFVESEPATVPTSNVDILESDITGERITVRYESVMKRTGQKEIVGDVTAMLPAPDDESVEYKGVILRLASGQRRRIDLLEGLIECPHNSDRGWRRIGDLISVGRALAAGNPPAVATDGGER